MKMISDKRGSSSVLIILILLCLTTFSVLAVMSAYSDVKLARKSLTFASAYYALDTLGERVLRDAGALAEGVNAAAAEYIGSGGYLSSAYSGLPEAAAYSIFTKYGGSSPSAKELDAIRAEAAAYLFLSTVHGGSGEVFDLPDIGTPFYYQSSELEHPDYPGKHLSIEIAFSVDESGLINTDVVSWFQWQDAFEYSEPAYEVWDGTF